MSAASLCFLFFTLAAIRVEDEKLEKSSFIAAVPVHEMRDCSMRFRISRLGFGLRYSRFKHMKFCFVGIFISIR
ncbi:hypothetical protein J5N97_019489 [Dioscorea zingiberensis]|uniref:Secreted protein n=1 Tax=Dioscorea zingiberensis TaxID=325984 RepID=A0A9D5CG25_9LILI|nr:hypothetical protein J5N97_019489 [Dioscorea zingiberensis]